MVTPGIGDNFNDVFGVRGLVFVCLVMLLANFSIYLWAVKFGAQDSGMMSDTFIFADKNGTGEPEIMWTPLLAEKAAYSQEGYDLGWLDSKAWSAFRKVFGTYSPFFELIGIRAYGIYCNLAMFALSIFIGFVEGRVVFLTKRLDFGNISSTRYHIFVKLGLSALLGAMVVYISFPSGTNIPYIGLSIPVRVSILGSGEFWLTSPILWVSFLSAIGLVMSYQVSANLPRDI